MGNVTAKKVFKNIYWSYLLTFCSSVYGFITVPLLLKYFGAEEYGLINLAISMNVYIQLLDMGFSGTNVRFFSTWLAQKEYHKVSRLFSTSFSYLSMIGLINAVLLYVVSLFCDDFFDLTKEQTFVMKDLLYILIVNAILSWSTSVFDQVIKAGEHIAWLQKRAFIPLCIQVISVVLTLTLHLSLQTYFLITILSTLIIVPFTVFKLKKEFSFISFVPQFDIQIIKEIFSYSLSVFSFGIFQFSMQNLRPIILGAQSTLSSVSDYKIIMGIVGIVLSISGNFFGILLPTSSRILSEGNISAQNFLVYKGTKYVTLLLSFLIFGGILVSAPLLSLYVGHEYSYLEIWLSVSLLSLFVNHNQAISSLIFSQTNLVSIAIMSCISMTIGLSLSWVLAPHFGVGSVVVGYMIYAVFQTLFYYLYYWPQKMHLNSFLIFKGSFLPPVAVGFICFFILKILQIFVGLDDLSMFLIQGSLFVILYFLLVYFFILDKEDKSFFRRIIS